MEKFFFLPGRQGQAPDKPGKIPDIPVGTTFQQAGTGYEIAAFVLNPDELIHKKHKINTI